MLAVDEGETRGGTTVHELTYESDFESMTSICFSEGAIN